MDGKGSGDGNLRRMAKLINNSLRVLISIYEYNVNTSIGNCMC